MLLRSSACAAHGYTGNCRKGSNDAGRYNLAFHRTPAVQQGEAADQQCAQSTYAGDHRHGKGEAPFLLRFTIHGISADAHYISYLYCTLDVIVSSLTRVDLLDAIQDAHPKLEKGF